MMKRGTAEEKKLKKKMKQEQETYSIRSPAVTAKLTSVPDVDKTFGQD